MCDRISSTAKKAPQPQRAKMYTKLPKESTPLKTFTLGRKNRTTPSNAEQGRRNLQGTKKTGKFNSASSTEVRAALINKHRKSRGVNTNGVERTLFLSRRYQR